MFHILGAILVLLTGFIFVIISMYSFKNISNKLIFILAMMSLGMAIFSLGYSWELFSEKYDFGYMAIKFQYLGLSFLSVYWITFAYKFRKNKYPNILYFVLISLVPITTFFIVMTNDSHKLFYKTVEIVPYGQNFLMVTSKGPMYYVFIIYSYFVLLYMLLSFYFSFRYNKYNFKEQSKLMFIGSIIPAVFNLLYLFKLTPKNFDPTPFGFLAMTYFVYKAIFNYKFLDLKETIRGSTYDKITEGILVVDVEYRIVDFNNSASLLMPYLKNEHVGNNIKNYSLGKEIYENKERDFFEIQCIHGKKNLILEFRKNPIYVKNRLIAYIYIFSDISHAKEILSDLSYLATHDFLTGINNRMNFIKLADAEIYRILRYGGEFALVMIDIDYFKKVNDNYGHICGDEVLRALTELINNNLRTTDIFARLGGEEFCILLPSTALTNAQIFSEKIRKIVEAYNFIFNGEKVSITISIGLTYYSEEMGEISLEILLDLADKALYTSKKNGRNTISTLHLPLRH